METQRQHPASMESNAVGPRPDQAAVDRAAINNRTLENELKAILGGAFEAGSKLDAAIAKAKALREDAEAGAMKDMTRNQILELASRLAARVLLPSETASANAKDVMPKGIDVDYPASMEPVAYNKALGQKNVEQKGIDRLAVNQRILESALQTLLSKELNVEKALSSTDADRNAIAGDTFRTMNAAQVRELAQTLAMRFQQKKAERIAARLAK